MKFLLLPALFALQSIPALTQVRTKHVFIVTTDGLRWEEVFDGANARLLSADRDAGNAPAEYRQCDAATRRSALLPFFWSTIQQEGQLYGNLHYQNSVRVRNHFKISYPGYNEILTGHADPILIPNIRIRNRFHTILGVCNAQEKYRDRVAAFTTWKLFPYILNEQRDQLVLNPVCASVSKTDSLTPDQLTFCNAMTYLNEHKPDLVLLSFGETDEWAHHKNYTHYLSSAHQVDEMIATLWHFIQSDPYYRDETTLIITTDHGRGAGDKWFRHCPLTTGSGDAWLAVIGPDTAPEGEICRPGNLYQTQLAPSVAWLLGVPGFSTRAASNQLLSAVQQRQVNSVDHTTLVTR